MRSDFRKLNSRRRNSFTIPLPTVLASILSEEKVDHLNMPDARKWFKSFLVIGASVTAGGKAFMFYQK